MEIDEASANHQTTESDHVPLDINKLAMPMREKMKTLRPFSDECCIYRAPIGLRELDESSFTPRVISIGPLHHGKEELKAMEEHKVLYLQDLIKWSKVSMENLIEVVEESESRLHDCYAETIQFSSEEFVKMILLDAAFIIMVLLKNCFEKFKGSNDRIFGKPWMLADVSLDMILLENQLPFFILENLLEAADIDLTGADGEQCSLIRVAYKFFKDRWDCWLTEGMLEELETIEVLHFVHFIAEFQKPSEAQTPKTHAAIQSEGPHPLVLCRMEPHQAKGRKTSEAQARKNLKAINVPSVTELHQAGVKFKPRSSKCLPDIKFDKGIMEIPLLKIEDNTQIVFRNLQAFEQCHSMEGYIGNYISMINFHVISSKDVEILVQNGIIENWIHDNEAVTNVLHNVSQENALCPEDFIYASLNEYLNAHCKRPWNKWKATLKQDYFNIPWTIISLMAATFLLILTVIQTVCSVLQL